MVNPRYTPIQSVTEHAAPRAKSVTVLYYRDTGFPLMVTGVYPNEFVAEKAIKRLSQRMAGTVKFIIRP